MHRITFFPLGNADCKYIEVENDRLIIVDYAHVKTDDKEDRRWDIKTDLTAKLKARGREDVDVFCLTHLDNDHLCNAHEFFYLEHSSTYQSDDRFKILELWVPAGAITETGCTDDSLIWCKEARHRLREGKGIRVFGRPDRLKEWMIANGIEPASRAHLITDAGNIVPGFTLADDQLEFFLHSPHAHRINDREVEDRNQDCVVMQAVFQSGGNDTKAIFPGDSTWEALVDIVGITKYHGREERLDYDIFKVPHHCSYLSLSDVKGDAETTPKPEIKEWYDRGNQRPILVSSSKIVYDEEGDGQPPHFQAKNYYLSVTNAKSGQFKVTMEHPNGLSPEPLVIEIGNLGPTIKNVAAGLGVTASVNYTPPKAG